jgi:hypothetical protein
VSHILTVGEHRVGANERRKRRTATPIRTRVTSDKNARTMGAGQGKSTAIDHVNSVELMLTARVCDRSARPLTAGNEHLSRRKANSSLAFQANTVSSNEEPSARMMRWLPTP